MSVVELEGFEESVRELTEQARDDFGREVIEAWVEETNELLRNAPVGIGAPRSAGEWNLEAIADSAEIREEGGAWVAEWTATTDDGTPLIDLFEFGTDGPYTIEGDPLHWTDEETGEDVFATKVTHPGLPEVAAVRIGKNRMEMRVERGEFDAE